MTGRVRSVFSPGPSRAGARRTRRFTIFFTVFALILLVVNVVGWRVQASTRRAFEAELGKRLEAIAVAAAQPIDPDYVDEVRTDAEVGLGELLIRDHFQRLEQTLDVANLVLVDRAGMTLVDLSGAVERGVPHPIVRLHPGAFALAASGAEATSPLYESAGAFYKNGYAPILDAAGTVVAVAVVESGARYFETLAGIERVITLANGASGAVVLALGLFLYHVLRTQSKLDETIRRTESLMLMGELAASVAHEIKNPLGVIRATAERIKKRHGTDDEIFDYIPEEVDRLTAIVNTYLDFARRGTIERRGGEANVRESLEAVLRLVGRDADATGVTVETDVADDLFVALDPNALRQVLLNLVVNATQAMPKGGTVRVAAAAGEERVELSVADTGVGIAPDDLRNVFRPFYSGREKGTGLGLAIVHRVVTEAGGSIDVESKAGEGTTFTLRVPRTFPSTET